MQILYKSVIVLADVKPQRFFKFIHLLIHFSIWKANAVYFFILSNFCSFQTGTFPVVSEAVNKF